MIAQSRRLRSLPFRSPARYSKAEMLSPSLPSGFIEPCLPTPSRTVPIGPGLLMPE